MSKISIKNVAKWASFGPVFQNGQFGGVKMGLFLGCFWGYTGVGISGMWVEMGVQ